VLPIVHGLEKAYGDRITFVRVNILNPENAPLMKQFGFSATPEFYLVNGKGEIIGSWDDWVGEEDLREAFDMALDQTRG
jgi:protein-disulfide isomerase